MSRAPFNLTVLQESQLSDVSADDDMMYRAAMSHGGLGFESVLDRAVAEHGIVMPGLNEAQVRVIEVPKHNFTGNKPIVQARKWAKENIVGRHILIDSNGAEVPYFISSRAIDKYLSSSAINKSDNLGAHLSVLTKLPEVISESIEAEIHPDYFKGDDGIRGIENGYNEANLIHRFYGQVAIGGKQYRVKTTIIESRTGDIETKPHSFEVTNIELLSEDGSSKMEPTATGYQDQLPHGTANLLKGVEKSYDKGKKLLEESARLDLERMGDGYGTYSDAEVPSSQLESDYGRVVMQKIITNCGNIFMGAACNKETLEWAQNDVFGKTKQTSTSITINDSKISTSIS